MNDIDLIPSDYRARLLKQRWLRGSTVVAAVMVLLLLAAYAQLRHLTGGVLAEVAALQARKAISTQRRNDMERLVARKEELERQLQLLAGLRRGATAERMLRTIDRALDGDALWFLSWSFLRAGLEQSAEPGTPAVGSRSRPRGTGATGKSLDARMDTQMHIKGQARDHAALSNFVTRLVRQPEIRDVRILSTTLKPWRGKQVVDFDLEVTIPAMGRS